MTPSPSGPRRSLPLLREEPPALHRAVLFEVLQAVDQYLETGESAAIDLRSLPMTPPDRAELERKLGRGEITMHLAIAGDSEVWETRFAGVWWVRHRGPDGAVIAESLEIGLVPSIVHAQPQDVSDGYKRLRRELRVHVDGSFEASA